MSSMEGTPVNGPIRNIVAGIGEIEEEDPHLAPTIEMAAGVGATLHLVHAFPPPDPAVGPFVGLESVGTEGIERLRTEVTSRLQALASGTQEGTRVIGHAVPGSPSGAIVDVVQQVDADLVVLGATRLGPLASLVLGTTAQRVLRASPAPVLVKRRLTRDRPRRVLLTTDLSRLSEAAHERALGLITTLWGMRDISVRSLLVAGEDVLLPRPPDQNLALRQWAEEQLHDFLARFPSGELPVEGRVRMGLSAREILAEAEEWSADVLVLGSQGRTGASRFLIGSVAETVVRKAPCDVLLIPKAALSGVEEGAEATG